MTATVSDFRCRGCESMSTTLVLCDACTLVQLAETMPPETVFREASALAASVIAEKGLGTGHLVVEIASNDGYLLRNYKAAGVPVLGIQQGEYRRRGGHFIRPVPTATIL